MRFGVFLPNGSNGYIPSAGCETYTPSFQHNLAASIEAEKQGLDFILSMMKFRGFGGATGYWDYCLESFTLMSAIAARTERIGLFPTTTLLSTHPAVAARMVSTINDVSNGRCGLNVVTGWNRPEYSQMGLWPGDDYYDSRYDYAAEYLTVMKLLWTQGRASFQGKYFTLDDCTVLPTPGLDVPIVCAGQSPLGIDFTSRYGDHSFVMAEPPKLQEITTRMRNAAAATGRKVGIYANFTLVISDTDAKAKRICDDIVAGADKAAIENILASASMDKNAGGTSARLLSGLDKPIETGNLAFMGIPVIHGCAETVAIKINEIASQADVDGMLFVWPDYVQGIRDFGEKILPKLKH